MKGATKNQAQHRYRHRYVSIQQEATELRKGTKVEVTSDEEGFKDAWFVATLLKLPSTTPLKPSSNKKKKNPNYGKAYVEYQNLISDEDPSVRLREFVNAAFIRPLPPQETLSKPFELGDIVDANYSDGWWTGVITRLLPGSRFLVFFQNPPHEIEFGLSDLRYHLEWVNGNWLRPVNLVQSSARISIFVCCNTLLSVQKAASVMFSVGKKVEISLDSEGHQDSWLPATILEETGKGIFKTQYQIQGGGGQVEHRDAIVDSIHIRPSPPHLKDKNFFLLEKVDAFHDYGWRSGVITKELPDHRYMVFFKQSNKEREFNQSELRPHMEWKDGKWFTSSQDVSIPSDYQNREGNIFNSINVSRVAVSRCSSGSTKGTSSCSSGSTKGTSMVKLLGNFISEESHVGQSTPCNGQPSETAVDVPSDFVGEYKSTKGIQATVQSPSGSFMTTDMIEAPSEEKISNVLSSKSESVGKNFSRLALGGDQSSDSHSWGKRVKRKRMKFSELDESSSSGGKKNTDGFTDVPVEKALTSIQGKEGYAGGAADVEKEFMTIKTNLPIVIGLACDTMRSSRTKRSCQSTGQDSSKHTGDWPGLDDKELHSVTVINQFELGEISQKRRRGRPPRSATKSSIPSVPEQANISGSIDELLANDTVEVVEVTTAMDTVSFSQECVTNGSGKELMNTQTKQKHKTGIKNEEGAENSMKRQPERQPLKRGRKRTINLNTVSQVHASSNATEQKQADSNSEMITKESSNNMSDDQPLSKWFEEIHAPASHDGSSKAGVLPPGNVDHQSAGSELQCLPFIKNTILWSTIESMEVFQKMPQKPHFHPLEECKESSREGSAIGLMVTFSSVVEKVSRLQFDDPKVTMNEILETLVELETHGFDVQLVRDRVISLLSGKEKQENLENDIEQLDSEIGKHKLEKSKIDVEIDDINREIKDLQGKLSRAVSRKENEDREIVSLQSKVEGIKEGIKRIRCDFEGLGTLI